MRRGPLSLLIVSCLLSGSLWLFPFNGISIVTEIVANAIAMVLVAIAAWSLLLRGKKRSEHSRELSLSAALCGVGAIGAPALCLLLGSQRLNGIMATAVEAAVPTVVAITLSAAGDGAELLQTLLIPALVALTGTLLLLPVGLPASVSGWIGFTLFLTAALLHGACGVWCHRVMRTRTLSQSFAQVAALNALFATAIAAVALVQSSGRVQTFKDICSPTGLLLIALSALLAAALFGLLYLAPPLALASRFVLIPLTSAVEAFLLMHPSLSIRAAFGAFLMLLGAIACLRQCSATTLISEVSPH